mmetsp:Transcript_67790/g.119937  ORF Transcript_67790/g.119937 Transcript_67790/m.119937 type:complete len:223 (-) Transcript_67790:333-1001(-)
MPQCARRAPPSSAPMRSSLNSTSEPRVGMSSAPRGCPASESEVSDLLSRSARASCTPHWLLFGWEGRSAAARSGHPASHVMVSSIDSPMAAARGVSARSAAATRRFPDRSMCRRQPDWWISAARAAAPSEKKQLKLTSSVAMEREVRRFWQRRTIAVSASWQRETRSSRRCEQRSIGANADAISAMRTSSSAEGGGGGALPPRGMPYVEGPAVMSGATSSEV